MEENVKNKKKGTKGLYAAGGAAAGVAATLGTTELMGSNAAEEASEQTVTNQQVASNDEESVENNANVSNNNSEGNPIPDEIQPIDSAGSANNDIVQTDNTTVELAEVDPNEIAQEIIDGIDTDDNLIATLSGEDLEQVPEGIESIFDEAEAELIAEGEIEAENDQVLVAEANPDDEEPWIEGEDEEPWIEGEDEEMADNEDNLPDIIDDIS